MYPVKTFTRHKFRSNSDVTRKTYHPFSQVITDNILSPAILGLPNELPSVFSDEKGKREGCHAINLTHVDVLVFPRDMMWKNSKARFKVLWRR